MLNLKDSVQRAFKRVLRLGGAPEADVMVGCLHRLAHGRGVTSRTTRKTRGRVRDDPPAAVRVFDTVTATGHNGEDGCHVLLPGACSKAQPGQWFACQGFGITGLPAGEGGTSREAKKGDSMSTSVDVWTYRSDLDAGVSGNQVVGYGVEAIDGSIGKVDGATMT